MKVFRLGSLIPLLQELIHGLSLQDSLLASIAYFKVGLNIREVKISVNHIESKSMEGADAGRRQKICLLFEENQIASVLVTHVTSCRFGSIAYIPYGPADGLFYLFLHLRCRCIGEGYYEHAVYRTPVFQNEALYSLNENGGLT